jgi:hypothetical protein
LGNISKYLWPEVQDSKFKISGSRFKVQDSKFKVPGSKFYVTHNQEPGT